ncbi:tumor necrosis factor receptor superfamily member 10A-like [Rhineura floridana]|uniref:tumor necrosis factor receptor superfamily member 10A-like n=1 Tax=Rhineura floridana TaxID=261503 RepID=UPI002AC888A6|nr:tumor necrosis factor receptor superfamily member 10A-like [Rhineura floridana]
MAVKLALLLVWLAFSSKVESPPRNLYCSPGEYADSRGHCCKLCPAGTYIGHSCISPHTSGICASCIEGVDFTAHPNGLEQCFLCDECKSDKRMVRPCTVKSNTECQCNDGHYCPPSCEKCVRCKTKCPEGQIIVQKCNATTDAKCGSPPTESVDAATPIVTIGLPLLVIVIVGFVCVLIYFFCCRPRRNCLSKKEEEKDSKDCLLFGTSESQRGQLSTVSKNELPGNAEKSNLALGNTNEVPASENVPSAPPLQMSDDSATASLQSNLQESKKRPVVLVKKSSCPNELSEIYLESNNMVPVDEWNMLMRKSGLTDIAIEKIKCDYLYTDERRHQMLKALQARFGIKDALLHLLNGLWDMKFMHVYENLTNELIRKDIITLETTD